MKKVQLVLTILLLAVLTTTCSSTHSQLQQIAGAPTEMAVIKDAKGGYWAFPGSALKVLDKNRITLTGDQKIAYCAEGSGGAEKLAYELMGLRNRAEYSGGFGPRSISSSGTTSTTTGPDGTTTTTKDDPYSLTNCTVGPPKEPGEIQVADILYRGQDKTQ